MKKHYRIGRIILLVWMLSLSISLVHGENPAILFEAVKKGDAGRVEELIKGGADVNVKNKNNETALMFAASLGRFDLVAQLLKAGADVNVKRTHDQ